MWALLPVKRLDHAKSRLAGALTPRQRRRLSLCMAEDALSVLSRAAAIDGVMVVSCDEAALALAAAYGAQTLNTGADHGYIDDVLSGVEVLVRQGAGRILIIPADVPELGEADLTRLRQAPEAGITLCPAAHDGGTNALAFTPPLALRLMYGAGSFDRFRQEAARSKAPVTVARCAGLARDLDRLEDLAALRRQPSGGRAWRYARSLPLAPAGVSS